MKVLKFGGTSVADAQSLRQVSAIVKDTHQVYGGKLMVVVSAMSGVTNRIIELAAIAERGDEACLELIKKIEAQSLQAIQELIPSTVQSEIVATTKKYLNELEDVCQGVLLLGDLSPQTKDKMMSFGELISSKIVATFLKQQPLNVTWLDSRELIKTDAAFGHAQVQKTLSYERIQQAVEAHPKTDVFVVPGFIASDESGRTTTIGRGGSDYSASLYAVAVNASILEIWTDVSGMMTADPRLVKHAKFISVLDYATALELCHFGAKIIFPPTLEPVMQANIPILLKNTFAPQEKGTLISDTKEPLGEGTYTGISSIEDVAILNMRGNGIARLTNIIHRTFKVLAEARIPVLLTTQGSSEHFLSVAISAQQAFHALKQIEKEFERDIAQEHISPPSVETDLSLIALVGKNMKNHPGIAARMFSALGRNGINIRVIAQGASERNISTVISRKDILKANLTLHEEFFEEQFKVLHLFIVGVGNVGSKLLQQIHTQKESIKTSSGLRLKVVGIANSQKMIFNEEGIDLGAWKQQLLDASSEAMNIQAFIRHISKYNLRNSVFVDVTANQDVAMSYEQILQKSVSVVACNKIACSVDYAYYQRIKSLAYEHNVSLRFETNVGAALPIIGTLNELIKSGDEIVRIEAVLSGTLNFVFNHYDGTRSFASVVKQAQEEGYTEPDPRIDLSGIDVARKILILARESGKMLDISDVSLKDFLPKEVMSVPLEQLYVALEKHEDFFKGIYQKAKEKNCRLKYVATYDKGKACTGLEYIDPTSDMYHLYNKDNIVIFYTKRYKEQPLVVKGAGAGAEVTASGIFADILKMRY